MPKTENWPSNIFVQSIWGNSAAGGLKRDQPLSFVKRESVFLRLHIWLCNNADENVTNRTKLVTYMSR